MDGLRRWRADLETGRGHYANHPINRAVLDYQQALENVARLEGSQAGRRLPRRERQAKQVELAEWRARFSASVGTDDAIRTTERTRVDRAEAKVAGRLAGLYEQRELRDDWVASHAEAALRLAGIDREVEALDVVMGARPPAVPVSSGRGTECRRCRGERASVAGVDIEVELHQLHGAVGSELAHNGEPGDEHPGGGQDS